MQNLHPSAHHHPNNQISRIFEIYKSIPFEPPAGQHTVLACFYLTSSSGSSKIISLGTGTKCLPANRLPLRGEAIHDSHAEVLARRGAVRWFFEEMRRCLQAQESGYAFAWLNRRTPGGQFELNEDVEVHLYVSTLPCGDASMNYLAAVQDPVMAALKDSTPQPLPSSTPPSPTSSAPIIRSPSLQAPAPPLPFARGRDGYAVLSALRTKPGRADSPPTLCMSCSDKIASWNVLGIQQSLLVQFLKGPIYISSITIGVADIKEELHETVRRDCERAFYGRIEDKTDEVQKAYKRMKMNLPEGYELHRPAILFSGVPFEHSAAVVAQANGKASTSCNESLCWIADAEPPYEFLIHGLKRGVSPKHRFRNRTRPHLSCISLLNIYDQIYSQLNEVSNSWYGVPLRLELDLTMIRERNATYHQIKRLNIQYVTAKDALMGPGAPFSAWVRNGLHIQTFCPDGTAPT